MMKNEQYDAYTDVFNNSLNNLRRTIRIKLKAIRYSNKQTQKKHEHDENCGAQPISLQSMKSNSIKISLSNMLKDKLNEQLQYLVFRPIEQYEVDEESSIFYTSSE